MLSKFHGWKRKAGMVMLMLACAFVAGWVRGFTVQDLILLGAGQRVVTKGDVLVILTSSARDGFVWSTDRSEGITWLSGWQVRPTAGDDYFDPFASNGNSLISNSADYHWRLLGFEAAKYHGRDDSTFSFWRISYLSIVIPLTALSAYLLLSKSRIATPKVTRTHREVVPAFTSTQAQFPAAGVTVSERNSTTPWSP